MGQVLTWIDKGVDEGVRELLYKEYKAREEEKHKGMGRARPSKLWLDRI